MAKAHLSIRVTGWPLVPVLIPPLYSAVRLALWLTVRLCLQLCAKSSCIPLWLTVRLCLQLCAKFLYCAMADGTFVPGAVCQVPVLHYGWRYVCACSCVPSSSTALGLTVHLCLQLCAKFLYSACLCPQSCSIIGVSEAALPLFTSKWRLTNQDEVLQGILAELSSVRYICAT